jgi:hypothetical protein
MPKSTLFWSGAKNPLNVLSNFYEPKTHTLDILWPNKEYIPLHLRGVRAEYLTAEHAYVAINTHDLESAEMFCKGGKFSSFEIFKTWPISKKKIIDIYEKKKKYWGAKRNLGIVAKMVSNIAMNSRFAYQYLGVYMSKLREDIYNDHKVHYKIWKIIFEAKYVEGSFEEEILKSTLGERLYEFDRVAQHNTLWACRFEESTGKCIGKNLMGRFLTYYRDYRYTGPGLKKK